jgi:hypothetical protein
LIDHALLSNGPFGRETQFDPVKTPLLLLPFLVRAAQISRKALAVDWAGDRLQILPNGAFKRRAAFAWADMRVLAMKIMPSSEPGTWILPPEPNRLPSIHVTVLNGLDILALKTTVPATQASRTGAGSAMPDND